MYNLHTKKTWIRYGNGTHDNHTYKKVGWCQVTKKKKKLVEKTRLKSKHIL